MTTEIGPATPAAPAVGRARAWGTGIGLLATIGIVVGAMAVAGGGGSPRKQSPDPVTTQIAVNARPSSAPTSTTTTRPAASTTTRSGPAATPTVSRTTAVDVDGDGRPDAAVTRFVDKRTARVQVRLSTGKTLTSKAFPLYRQTIAGKVFAADLNGDRRSELLVSDPGADGIGYHLFTYTHSALVEVPLPQGQALYIGGGMYYAATFGCTAHRLVRAQERPDVTSTATLPADPRFLVTTTRYTLTAGSLKVAHAQTVKVRNRAAAGAVLGAVGNGCGTRP
jgi:hypothetical protein